MLIVSKETSTALAAKSQSRFVYPGRKKYPSWYNFTIDLKVEKVSPLTQQAWRGISICFMDSRNLFFWLPGLFGGESLYSVRAEEGVRMHGLQFPIPLCYPNIWIFPQTLLGGAKVMNQAVHWVVGPLQTHSSWECWHLNERRSWHLNSGLAGITPHANIISQSVSK